MSYNMKYTIRNISGWYLANRNNFFTDNWIYCGDEDGEININLLKNRIKNNMLSIFNSKIDAEKQIKNEEAKYRNNSVDKYFYLVEIDI